MLTRERIIREIRQLAERDGRPSGRKEFEIQTGIRMSEWYGIHFLRWGDALREAGYKPNKKREIYSSEHVLRKFAEAVRELGHIPTVMELRMYSRGRNRCPRLWYATTFYVRSQVRDTGTGLPSPGAGEIRVKHGPIMAASAGRLVVLAHSQHRIGASRPYRSQHEIQFQAEDPNIIYEVCASTARQRGFIRLVIEAHTRADNRFCV